MREFSAPQPLSHYISDLKKINKTIGLVPTMGALHEGHLSLIKKAKEDNDIVIVSIFVNPLQFNNDRDLTNYPRTLDLDIKILKDSKVDILFAPSELEMYPTHPRISIHFGELANVLEGQFRKNHFEGVGVVVGKLLNVVLPDRAYFGLKDLQQFLLVKQMCKDLSFAVKIVGVETVRNENGLALSSRNLRLSKNGLNIAENIYNGLKIARKSIANKEAPESIKNHVNKFYKEIEGLKIEYFEIVNTADMTSINSYKGIDELAICVAGYVDGIRLIDNLYLRLKK